MNKKMIVYILGKMMGVEGLLLLIPALVSLIYHEKSVISFMIVAAILLVIYMVFGRKLPASKQIYGKEGFVIVGLAWILWSAFGALPFVISGPDLQSWQISRLCQWEFPSGEALHTGSVVWGYLYLL